MSETGFLRRESRGLWADFCHRMIVGFVGLGVMGFFIISAHVIDQLLPASPWYRLDSVTVADFRQGEEASITIEREIVRPFSGTYQVTIWPEGGDSYVCIGTDKLDYTEPKQGALRNKTLSWWAANQRPPCLANMPPGKYQMQTCVNVHMTAALLAWLPDRQTCVWSNEFRVLAD